MHDNIYRTKRCIHFCIHGIRFQTVSGNTATKTKYGFTNNSNVVSTTPYYFYTFDPNDIRRNATVGFYNYTTDNKEVFLASPYAWTFQKWDQRFNSSTWLASNLAANGKVGYGINWCIMRYSDVLLMFAETENEINGGPTTDAITALKLVRQRAFASSDWPEKVDAYVASKTGKDAFFDAIVNERAWEFGGEGVRKYDLIRWNLLVTKIADQRAALINMMDNGMAPNGSTIPTALWYKYKSGGEIIDKENINFYSNFDTTGKPGYTKVDWMKGYSDANKTTYKDQATKFSSGLTQNGVNNRHLYPIHSSAIAESQGLLKNSYGF